MAPHCYKWLAACLVWSLATCASAQTTLDGQEKRVLNLTKASWAHFRDFDGKQLIYFTHLEVYRCAIKTVRYSLNGDALDRLWRLQPCDPDKPHHITTDRPYVSLPLGSARSITLELTYLDGSKTAPTRIGADNKLIDAPAAP